MRTITDHHVVIEEVKLVIDEPVEMLVLAFPWTSSGDDQGPAWKGDRMALGWHREGLVLMGAGTEPLLFPLPETVDELAPGQLARMARGEVLDQNTLRENIAEYGAIVVCAKDDNDNTIAIMCFEHSEGDVEQTHLMAGNSLLG